MTSDDIRRTFIEFFEERGHLRLPSSSLIPTGHDPSALFTVAGMHPLKPYFMGREKPPRSRVTTCQKTFRTVDIDIIGTTTRHLTFFEMLGNFSFGDYFKREATRFAWELSTQGFGFPAEKIWITVFAGDDELGIGADEEAIAAWVDIGVPRERIVECPRSENWWELPRPARVDLAPSSTWIGVSTSARPTTFPAATTSASSSTGTWCSCSSTRTR